MSKAKNSKSKGLSDAGLVRKYERGKIDMERTLEQAYSTGKNIIQI